MGVKNKFISLIISIVFLVYCIPVYANSTFSFFIEAEDCTITSRLRIGNDSAASGGHLVDLMCTIGDEISFEVTVPESGIYTVNMRYANAYNNAPATATLYVNDKRYKQIMVENTNSWNNYAISIFTIELTKGKNKLAIRYDPGDTGNFNFDYFEILSGDLTQNIKKEDHLSYSAYVAKLLNNRAEFKTIATDHKILVLFFNGEASFHVQPKYDGVYELKIHYMNKNKDTVSIDISSNGVLLTTVSAKPTAYMSDFSDVVTTVSLRKGINTLVLKNTSQNDIEISRIELNYIKGLQYSEYDFLYKDMQDLQLQRIVSLLDCLGIMKSFTDNTFRPGLGVTRAEFVEMAVKMAYGTGIAGKPAQVFQDVPVEHWASRYINAAVESGLISKDVTFRPNEPITMLEAVMILVRAIGHDYLIHPDDNMEMQYLNIAFSQKIISDYNSVKNTIVSRKTAAILLYNTLNAKLFKPVSYGDHVRYQLSDSDTLLNTIHKVRRVTGVVYASDLIKLVGVDLKTDEILLDNEIFKIGDTKANELVGYKVEAFVKRFASDDHERVISIGKLDNTKLKISAMDILSKTTSDKLFYLDRKANEEKAVSIDSQCIILYNQMVIQNVSVADFMPSNGFVEVIDNDNDSYADVVFIHDLKTYIASDPCLSDNNFTVKDLNGRQPQITINLNRHDKKVLFYENGIRCNPKAVATGNVIEIGESVNYIEIYVSTYTTSGVVTEVNHSEGSVVVNGNEYYAVRGYLSQIDVSVGDEVELRLNTMGEIADVIVCDDSKQYYGFITKLGKIDDISGAVQMKMFTQDAEWKVFELADRVRINGIIQDKEDIFTVSGLFSNKFEGSDITLSGNGVWLDSGRDTGFSAGDSIRGWDPIEQNVGSALEIRANVYSAGFYRIEVRYTTPNDAKRQIYVDGKPVGYINMPKTGGWFSDTLKISDDSPLFYLAGGSHSIKLVLEDTTQGGVDVDYIAVKNQNGSYVTHMVPQLISYSINAENKINKIDVAVEYNPWIKSAANDEIIKNNSFRVTSVSEYYSAGTNSFRGKIYLSDGKRIKFLIPNDMENEQAFQIEAANFGHDIWYNVKCYNVDQYGGNCSLIVEKYDSSRHLAEGKLYIVDSMGQKVNGDGETVTTITVFGGKTKEVLECDPFYTPMDFPKGSVIQAYFTNNLLSNATLIFDGKKENITYDISNPYQSNSVIKGKIEAISEDKKMVTISGSNTDVDADGNPKVIHLNISNAQVGLYHTSSKRITSGDANDISIGDIVLIGTKYQVPLSIVVIKD